MKTSPKITTGDRIFVAGHRGLVGSATVKALEQHGFKNLVLRTRDELNLLDQKAVFDFFRKESIDHVILAAARVGGIVANQTDQIDFLYENAQLELNVIRAAADHGVKKLLFLGSSCIYPKDADQPIKEEFLLTGPLEETNEGYALAKILGVRFCHFYNSIKQRAFTSAMPSNLYGPGDSFHPMNSHAIPGLLRRFHEAKIHHQKSVVVWGTGRPRREFLYVDDLAAAIVLLFNQYHSADLINVGTGIDLTIRELAEMMKRVVGFTGELSFDASKPDGVPQKLLDSSRMKELGWKPKVALEEGLRRTYEWALHQKVFENKSRAVS